MTLDEFEREVRELYKIAKDAGDANAAFNLLTQIRGVEYMKKDAQEVENFNNCGVN